jgi:hypothetical protein
MSVMTAEQSQLMNSTRDVLRIPDAQGFYVKETQSHMRPTRM